MVLESVSEPEPRAELGGRPKRKPTLRLVAAFNYKHGVPVGQMAEMYGVPERTIYNRFDRLESTPVREAIRDEHRPGRPPRPGAAERAALEAALRESPREAGYYADEWTPRVVARHVERAFGVEFSTRHVRRILDDLEP